MDFFKKEIVNFRLERKCFEGKRLLDSFSPYEVLRLILGKNKFIKNL